MIGWFKEGIFNERLNIIFNPSHFLVFNYIFNGIILKRKGIEIQWRKFGLKRSCISQVMNFWSFQLFRILIWFLMNFNDLFIIKIAKRGFLFHRPPECWRGTRSWCGAHGWLTWHARPARMRRGTQCHVAGPREPTWGAGGAQGADTWQEATRVHADACEVCHMARGLACKGPTG